MFGARTRGYRRESLLTRYGAQLGSHVERHDTELALVMAKEEAERMADAAAAAMEKAQAADRAKTEFLANMSHELRTPLNAIIGFSDMMHSGLMDPVGDDKRLEYAHDINQSGRHLLNLINDILDLAKVEAGQAVLHEEAVTVATLVEECFLLLRDRAAQRGITLRLDLDLDGLDLMADERKLKQILINLLSNAVKFTPEGGVVTVRGFMREHRGCVLKVVDTGIGIAKEDIWKALAPFHQVDSALNRKYEGTGLGLPLSKGLVELHGGILALESEPGTGTMVTVSLPPARVVRQVPAGQRS